MRPRQHRGLVAIAITVGQLLAILGPTPVRAAGNDAPAYPLKVSSNGHYLVDQGHQPFLVVADTAWSLMQAYTTAQATQYLEDRRIKGFNTINVFVSGYSPETPNTNGDYPFIGNDLTQPNAAWFSHVDDIINIAAAKGIQLYLGTANLGSKSCSDPHPLPYKCYMTTSNATSLGQYLWNRYKNLPNIIWTYGGDTSVSEAPNLTPLVTALDNGIKQYDTNHIASYHITAVHSSSEVYLTSSWHKFSSIQTYYNDATNAPYAYRLTQADYSASTIKPTLLVEPCYEGVAPPGDPTTTPYHVRQATGWASLSGALGVSIGSDPFFGSSLPQNWASYLNRSGTLHTKYIAEALQQYDWYVDVPDTNTSHQLVTSGYGTYGSATYATAAVASDGSHGWVYVPARMSPVVNMGKFSSSVTAKWYDPTTGTASLVGTFPNSGSRTFASPAAAHADGTQDYLLELKAGAQREVARWRFNEASGSTAADATSNGHTATLFNSPGHVTGVLQNGLSFNGTNQYATVPDADDLDFTTKIKIDVWVKFASGAGTVEQKLLVKDGAGAPDSSYGLRVASNGSIGLKWGSSWYQGTPLNWSNGTWYHIIAQHDGSKITLIRDGVNVGSITNSSTTWATTGILWIGRGMPGFESYFNGTMDELQLKTS
ncbi:MAG TPA: DUF4038 domain-containing protein [Chloroflexota bacterium]|nr:DUF4038 domain-containing protein [Chloroflexota bacterium]